MIRSITELVPFGEDNNARNISVMYLANLGRVSGNNCDYFIAYYESPSYFSGVDGIRKYKFVADYDRNNPTLKMLSEVYKDNWYNITDIKKHQLYDEYVASIIVRMDSRAKEDLNVSIV